MPDPRMLDTAMALPAGVPPLDRLPIDHLLERLPFDSPLREALLEQTSLEPVGDEFQVNAADPDAEQGVDVAQLANGNAIVIWNDYGGEVPAGDGQIHGQLLDPDGNPIGTELVLTSGTPVRFYEFEVTALEDGGFVVAWTTDASEEGGSGRSVMAQLFSSEGVAVTDEFQVNTMEHGHQHLPDVAALEGGGFVVTWTHQLGQFIGGDGDVRAQMFAADGTRVGTEIAVNTPSFQAEYDSQVAGLAGGGFVITWTDITRSFDSTTVIDVHAQVFSSTGERASEEMWITDDPLFSQQHSDVAATADGGFVVVWMNPERINGFEVHHSIRGQQYDSNLLPVGTEFMVTVHDDTDRSSPTVAGLAEGGFVVGWDEGNLGLEDAYVRAFIDWDTPWTDAMPANTQVDGRQFDTEVAAFGDGFIVGWIDDQGTSLIGEVEARVYDLLL